jgi:hypothetical protein
MKISIVSKNFSDLAISQLLSLTQSALVLAALLWLPTSAFSFQMNTYPNRHEGTRIQDHALEDFTLLAIHRSSVSFSPHSVLSVRYYLPSLQDNDQNRLLPTALFLQAAELRDWHQYFMSAKTPLAVVPNSYNLFTPWPTQDVIDQLHILPSNLGVLAGYKLSGRTVYLPVDVYDSSPTASTSATVYLLTGNDLQKIVITVSDLQGHPVASAKRTITCKTSLDPDCIMYSAGSTVPLTLDFSGLPTSVYEVNVDGHLPGTLKRTSINFLIYFNQLEDGL